MIILEGPNATGKSTLASLLCRDLNLKYYKVKITKETASKLDFKWYVEETQKLSQNYLVDRWHLGQVVYPQLYKDGRVPLTIGQQHLLERILMVKGTLLIRCSASRKFMKHVYDTRGEKDLSFSESARECKLFDYAYNRSILPKLIYSPEFTDQQLDHFRVQVVRKIQHDKNKWSEIYRFKGTGNINHPVMLVGDCFNKNESLKNYAFSSIKGCSEFLHKTLSITKNPSVFYITNAHKTLYTAIDIQLLFQELDLFQPRSIIALGQIASELLKKAKIQHKTVPHPQFVKRFKHNKIKQYAKLIDKSSRR